MGNECTGVGGVKTAGATVMTSVQNMKRPILEQKQTETGDTTTLSHVMMIG